MTAEDLLDGLDEELGVSGAQERDWKGIATALLVIMLICCVIAVALVMFTPLTASSHVIPRRLNASELALLRPPFGKLQWLNDDLLVETPYGFDLIDPQTKIKKVLFEKEQASNIQYIIPSFDGTYFAQFRPAPNPGGNPQNATKIIKIIDNKNRITHTVKNVEGNTQKTFLWNPVANDFVFVEKNRLFYSESPASEQAIPIGDAKAGIVDGVFDWIYNEEIFSSNTALWWSEDGILLAYASHDARLTKNATLKSYHKNLPYPIETGLPYPKTFEKWLPVYTVSIWNKLTRESRQMDIQLRDSLSFHYLYAVSWVRLSGQNHLVTVWANRYQNQISVNICNFDTATCSLEFEYTYAPKRWAQSMDFNPILARGQHLYFLLPRDTHANSYQHIARLRITGSEIKTTPAFLPSGSFDVTTIEAIDNKNDKIYFSAAAPNPGDRNLYVTKASAVSSEAYECITCGIANCSYQTQPQFNFRQQIVALSCRGPAPDHALLVSIKNSDFKYSALINDTAYQNSIEDLPIPVHTFETVTVFGEHEARVKLTMPKDALGKDKAKSTPLLVFVYGGPISQEVDNRFKIGHTEMLCSQLQIALLKIDGRGSGFRGWRYKEPVYGALGTVEVEDQLEAIKAILDRHSFLDPSRVAVFGWSYGGFMALNMVEKAEPKFFKCAVSVAPVTNFMYYDATYTERYMGDAGVSAYEASDVTNDVEKFKRTKLLLMHGLLDDNVHFQNSAIFINELQAKGIDFDLMVYPNQAHGIGERRSHVFGKIEHFLRQCFFSHQ